MTILMLRARGGESRFAQMLIKGGYYCAQYPQFVETPLPFGVHTVANKLLAAKDSPLVDTDFGVPAIAISDTVALDVLIDVLMSNSAEIPVTNLPFRLVLIGDKAIRYSEQVGITPSLTIPGLCSEAISDYAAQLAPLNLMLLTSDKPPEGLVAELGAICQEFEVAKVFARCKKMEPPPVSLAITAVVSCTSTAICRDTMARLDPSIITRPFFAIGPKTAAAAREFGFDKVIVAETDTLVSLYQEIARHFGPPLLGRAL